MPISLVLIRHGESESNKAKSLFEAGKLLSTEDALMQVHTSERRLTPLGIEQAHAAGQWLREHWYDSTRSARYRFYVSPYVRAMETAGHIGLGPWRHNARLMERNWGDFDQLPYAERKRLFEKELMFRKDHAFFWRPTNGETLQDVFARLDRMRDTLHRDYDLKKIENVAMVSHGETMWVWRTLLERLLPKELSQLMLSDDDRIWIHNCRIIEYTRFAKDGSLAPRFVRVRFVDPLNPSDQKTNSGWMDIPKREWTAEQLLEYTSMFPSFIPDEDAA